MYKKIGIIFLALIVFLFPMQMKYIETANAAIATKVAGKAAKEIAQEVIKDVAVETGVNFALKQAMDIVTDYEAKDGYKIVCPSGATSCDNPVQVKENLTDSDKANIKNQAGTELDKLITNGKGLTKWQKFLDWFVPVWLVSFGATALTYAFDGEVRSLFNEAGYNTLVALGIIQPVTDMTKSVPLSESAKSIVDGTNQPSTTHFQHTERASPYSEETIYNINAEQKNVVVTVTSTDTTLKPVKGIAIFEKNTTLNQRTNFSFHTTGSLYAKDAYASTIAIRENGETVYSETFSQPTSSAKIPDEYSIDLLPDVEKMVSRMPYIMNGKTYTDATLYTKSGRIIDYQSVSDSQVPYLFIQNIHVKGHAQNNSTDIKYVVDTSTSPFAVIPLLPVEEMEPYMPASTYENENGDIALIPPTALTYKEESTGETVERSPNATGDGVEFKKPDGTIVPEENVTVNPAPTVTPAPEGSTDKDGKPIPQGTPTVTPEPTENNPNPKPIPLTPTTPEPEPETPPPSTGEPEPPLEPFPDGESCDAKLQFPVFSPLQETFSTSFPFSIPWDIGRAIEAAFGGISDEKPNFTLDLAFLGETKEIEITVPTFFDKWKPFTDTMLLLTFDVLIMFGVYRFVKGAGS